VLCVDVVAECDRYVGERWECVCFVIRRSHVCFLIRRSHSISFPIAQGIPKYKIGFGRGKGWESWGKIG
jgi:hypothetical protein